MLSRDVEGGTGGEMEMRWEMMAFPVVPASSAQSSEPAEEQTGHLAVFHS